MVTATKSNLNIFADLIAKMEVENEKKKNNIVKLTVRQALAVAKQLHENEYSASEIYTVIASGHDAQMKDVDVNEILLSITENYADEIIDIWREKLFMAKMTDGKKVSEWRESLAHMLADPDAIMSHASLKLVSSLPRFHEYEERYSRLALDYRVSDKRVKYKNVTVQLEYVESWEEKSSKNGRRKVYAFRTKSDQLVVVHVSITAYNSAMYIDQLLKFTKTFNITGYPYSRRVGPNQFVPQFDRIFDLEAIDENV